MAKVHGPYLFTEEDLERFESWDPSDVGRWYIIITRCIQFVESHQGGMDLIRYLN